MKFARGFSEFVPDSTAAVSDVDANLSWAIRNSRSANSALEVFPHSLWLGRHSPRKAKLSETEYRSDYSEQDGRCAINFSQAGIAVGNIEPFLARLRPSLNVAPGAEGHARSSTVSSCPDFHAGYSRRQASGHVARSVHWRCAVSGRTFNLLPNLGIAAGSRSPAHYSVTRELAGRGRDIVAISILRSGIASATQFGKPLLGGVGSASVLASDAPSTSTLHSDGSFITLALSRPALAALVRDYSSAFGRPIFERQSGVAVAH